MYRIFKTILISIFPKKFLINNEFLFRSLYAVLYSGDSYQCNVCNCKLRKFVKNNRKELLCPKCGSLSRDRRLFDLNTMLFYQLF